MTSEMKKSDQYSTAIEIRSLKDLNQKQICSSYFQKVLENKKTVGRDFCEKNRINKNRNMNCSFLCESNQELYTFWDSLVAIDTMKERIKSNSESKEKLVELEYVMKEGYKILYEFIKNVYVSITERMNNHDRDFKIVLTVDSKKSGKDIIDTIIKYYEVSNDYSPYHPNDSVKLPIFTRKNNSSTLGKHNTNLDYQIHYIARDIGRIFGSCPTYSDGEECRHGLKCRNSIHLTVSSKRGEVLYSIDDHLKSFREYISDVADNIFNDLSVYSEEKSQELTVNTCENNSVNSLGYRNACSKPESKIKPVKVLKDNTKDSDYNINYWSKHWFGDEGVSNINKLIDEMNEKETERPELSKLIRRLLWKSNNSSSKNKNFDSKEIMMQWKAYQGYKDGTNNYNIDYVSINCATSEKHLSADYKTTCDDKQRLHKNGRKDSYRYNNFGGNDSRVSSGHNVFSKKMENLQIDNIENMHLDVMAEYLDIKIFEDSVFLVPTPRESSSFTSKVRHYIDNENYGWIGEEKDLKKLEEMVFGMTAPGLFLKDMFQDRNIMNEYNSIILIPDNCSFTQCI